MELKSTPIHNRIHVGAALILSMLAGSAAVAQADSRPLPNVVSTKQTTQPLPPATPAPAPVIATSPSPKRPAPEWTLSVQFPGGTVREYLGALRGAAGGHAVNVVAPAELMDTVIGEVSLNDVDVFTAVRAIEMAEGTRSWMVNPLADNAYGLSPTGSRVRNAPSNSQRDEPAILQVYSIKEMTDAMPGDPLGSKVAISPDVILTAVQTVLKVGADRTPGAHDAASVKYHADSGLLIVSGNREQVSNVDQALQRMRTDVNSRRMAAKESSKTAVDIEEVRAESEKQMLRMELLKRNIINAQDSYAKAKALHEAGSITVDEVSSARARLDQMTAEYDAARIDQGLAMAKLQRAESQAAALRKSTETDSVKARADAARRDVEAMTEQQAALRQAIERLNVDTKNATGAAKTEAEKRILQLAERDKVMADEVTALRKRADDLARQAANASEIVPPDAKGPVLMMYDVRDLGKEATERVVSLLENMKGLLGEKSGLKVQNVSGSLAITATGNIQRSIRGLLEEVRSAKSGDADKDGDGGGAGNR